MGTKFETLATITNPRPALATKSVDTILGGTVALDGTAGQLPALKGQWLLISVAGGACDATCEKHLYLQRQLREMMGRERDRIDKVWFVTDGGKPPPALREATGGAVPVQVLKASILPMPRSNPIQPVLAPEKPLSSGNKVVFAAQPAMATRPPQGKNESRQECSILNPEKCECQDTAVQGLQLCVMPVEAVSSRTGEQLSSVRVPSLTTSSNLQGKSSWHLVSQRKRTPVWHLAVNASAKTSRSTLRTLRCAPNTAPL